MADSAFEIEQSFVNVTGLTHPTDKKLLLFLLLHSRTLTDFLFPIYLSSPLYKSRTPRLLFSVVDVCQCSCPFGYLFHFHSSSFFYSSRRETRRRSCSNDSPCAIAHSSSRALPAKMSSHARGGHRVLSSRTRRWNQREFLMNGRSEKNVIPCFGLLVECVTNYVRNMHNYHHSFLT